MSRFLNHAPCPSCGSKDNLGIYDDHEFCFGCKHTRKYNDLNAIRARLASKDETSSNFYELSVSPDIPIEPLRWLLSYGLTKKDALDAKFGWNEGRKLLILANLPDYWQARSFDKEKNVKYASQGKKPILTYSFGDICVLTEDIVSAVKVSKLDNVCATPLLGSTIPQEWVYELSGRFKKIFVWLDKDKQLNSLKIAREFKQRGVECRSIITDLDPKEYNLQEILDFLKN